MAHPMTDTRMVVERYLAAVEDGDVRAMVDVFADDVVVVRPEGTVRGRRAIQHECEELDGMFAPGTYRRVRDRLTVEGEVAQLVWHADCLGTRIAHAVTTFIVRDGRIAAVSATLQADPV